MTTGTENGDSLLTIGQVVELLSADFPDITHSSLRFLEREGLIEPNRTAGRHRLFPPDQVERIRSIKVWQAERLSLADIRERLVQADHLPGAAQIAEAFFDLAIAGERSAAQRLILEAAELGTPLVTIFDDILRPVLRETGERWMRNEITVGQEKEISAFCRDLIAHLGSRHRNTLIEDHATLVAACVEGENHELGLRMVTSLLRSAGHLVHYLGPSVEPAFLIERITARQPDLVLLAAMREERLPAMNAAISAIEANHDLGQPLIVAGGAGVPRDWKPTSDHVVVVASPTLAGIVDQIEGLLADRAVQAR